MTELQKAIKYIAIALAVFLAVSIVGGILGVIGVIAGVSSMKDDGVGELSARDISGDITDIKIEIGAAELKITTGEAFALESNLKDLKSEVKNGMLVITEKTRIPKNYSAERVVILTVPGGFSFGEADITTGAGKVTIDTLSADRVRFELGAGDVKISELSARSSADIDGGAGRIEISGGAMHDLSLNMGVGELDLASALSGDADLDYGIGKAMLTLIGKAEDYRISVEKGIGAVTVDGEEASDDGVYGSGNAYVDIDGGIGKIDVVFKGE